MNRPSTSSTAPGPNPIASTPGSLPPVANGVRSARLGELDAGVVAIAGRGAVATVAGGDTRVAWWIGAEDRWHRPEVEPSTRDRLLDGAPVVESSVRIPSGDAVGRVAVARVGGVPRPSVVLDVENVSPLPVAFAYVVESRRPVELTDDGVLVDGVGQLVLTRPALGYAVADDADALVEVLESGAMTPDRPSFGRPGAVAVLVPLPHTAHAVATFTPDCTAADVKPLSDRESVPGPERIVAGWATHAADAPRLDVSARHQGAFNAAVCDVLLDAGGGAGSGAVDAVALGRTVEALGRLGRTADPTLLVDLLDLQRSNGSLSSADPVAATLQLVRSLAAWWAGGADPEFAEMYLGPMADAVRWLDKRRQRAAVAADPVSGPVLVAAAATFDDLGQPEVAAAVRDAAARFAPEPVPTGGAAAMLVALGDGLAWGGRDAGGTDAAPDVGESARFVVATIDDAVRDDGDSLALLTGWMPSDAGSAFEAHDVPTRAGHLSFGLRWHGERPALLWELTPWPGRSVPAWFRLTAPAIDATWSATDAVGEALLARPDGVAAPTPEPEAPARHDTPEAASSSSGDPGTGPPADDPFEGGSFS